MAATELLTGSIEQFRRTRSIARGLAAVAISRVSNQRADHILRTHWAHDHQAALIAKAAVSPMMMADADGASKWLFLSGIAPQSAAVRVFAGCERVDMEGVDQLLVSTVAGPAPVFLGEEKPFPMAASTAARISLGPTKKMMVGTALTNQLEFCVPETASTLISRALTQKAGPSLDVVVFDAVAASDDRPPGLLNGVVPLAASTATGVIAMTEDLRSIAAAMATAGCDPERMIIVANSSQALALRLLSGPRFTNEIIGTAALAAGTIVGIDPAAVISGYSGVPEIETSNIGAVHMEDASPAALSTVGTPNVVAAPVLNAYQQNLLLLKLRLRCCWGVMVPGGVQVINSVVW